MKTRSANHQPAFYSGWMNRCLLISFIFTLSLTTAKAQYVTIPDAAFVTFLQTNFPACMSGNQMDTTCAGIVNATSVNCSSKGIGNLEGIQYFDNLKDLDCSDNGLLDSIPSLPSGLLRLHLWNTIGSHTFNNPVIAPFPAGLRYLDISGNYFIDSLPPLPAGLDTLNCMDDNLSFLPALPPGLVYLDCSWNEIPNIPPLPSTLKVLICGLSWLWQGYTFNYTHFPPLPAGLVDFYSVNGVMPPQFLSQFTSFPAGMKYFTCNDCGLTSLPMLPNGLEDLSVNNNQLTSLPPLPATINQLSVADNQLTSLDLPNIYPLFSLDISGNPFTCLPPSVQGASFFRWENTQMTCLSHYPSVGQTSTPPLNTLPLCDFFNNPNSCDINWNISGRTYFDQDSNCTFDATDVGLGNIPVQLWSGGNLVQQVVNGAGNGVFAFNTNMGNFQLRVSTTGLPFDVRCPANNQLNSSITPGDSLDSGRDFALKCKPGFDLEARSIGAEQFRPGRTARVNITAGEIGQFYGAQCASGLSGSVIINMSGPVTYIGPSAGALTPTAVVGDMLIYSIADFGVVNPSKDFDFTVRTDTSAQAGQTVCFTLTVLPTAGDRDGSNNIINRCYSVVNSYDPNDKQVSPIGNIDTAQHWLTYTVRFQNTGTAEAIDIHIDDTLDSNLDESTFQLLAYSHETLVQLNSNTVRFDFQNINLPDSTSDEPGSHGYVQYKVKLKDNLPLGTVISNSAAIYFDFNEPVITNTVQTTIGLKFSGTIVTESGSPVPNVTVNLSGDASQNALSDTGGVYELASAKLGSFIVMPSKNNDDFKTNGVSTLDVALIRRHILGNINLSSPYKIIAADVNSSNSVTIADITVLRNFILGRDTTFNGKLWSFVSSDYVFPDSLDPFPFDDFRNYPDLNANQVDQDFIGVKLGDVSGNWDSGIGKTGATGEVQFAMGEYNTLPDDEVTIPVKVRDFKEIAGYQFTLTWDAAVIELLEVNSKSIPGYYGRFDNEGLLTTSWNDFAGGSVTLADDAVAFELKFRVIGAPGTSAEIRIGSEITSSEAYTNQLDLLDIRSTQGRVTVGDKTTSIHQPSSALQLNVQPNPFSNSTNIIFSIPQTEQVQIEIYDVLLKEVKTFTGTYKAGMHSLQWNGEDNNGLLLAKGTYYVKLVSRNDTIGERILLMR